MKKAVLFLVACALENGAFALSPRWVSPQVRFSASGHLIATAAHGDAVSKQAVQIVESEACSYRRVSDTDIQVPERCGFLSGMYRYSYFPFEGARRRQRMLSFSLSRSGPGSHVLMVSPSFLLAE